jgi:hypothetical protein
VLRGLDFLAMASGLAFPIFINNQPREYHYPTNAVLSETLVAREEGPSNRVFMKTTYLEEASSSFQLRSLNDATSHASIFRKEADLFSFNVAINLIFPEEGDLIMTRDRSIQSDFRYRRLPDFPPLDPNLYATTAPLADVCS